MSLGARLRLAPKPPLRQDPEGPGPPVRWRLPVAGPRRRAMLSGGLPVPPARTGCLSSSREEPRPSTCAKGSGGMPALPARANERRGLGGYYPPSGGGSGGRRGLPRGSPQERRPAPRRFYGAVMDGRSVTKMRLAQAVRNRS
ncbi:hypothetical protein ADP8_05217 [Roseomonas mucosa]|nr:hypothetical protein ADP8_05217 [Roseomonas mucosa]